MHVQVRAHVVLFVTRLENFKMDVFFVTFDQRFKVESRRIWRRHSLLAAHAGHVPLRILSQRPGGKREKEKEKKRERISAPGALSTVTTCLSLFLTLSPLRYSTTIARANTMETALQQPFRNSCINKHPFVWPTSLRFRKCSPHGRLVF